MKSEFYYIVYLGAYTSYSRAQGNGYYVGYKDKLSDHFSKYSDEAKRYKSLGGALSRIGFNPKIYEDSKDVVDRYDNDINLMRVQKIGRLTDKPVDVKKIKTNIELFDRGRIEKIEILRKNGETKTRIIGTANEEIYEHVKKIKTRFENKWANYRKNIPNSYTDPADADDEFWD